MELPMLREARCTDCGDCVPICPTDCLAMKGGMPWLARPRACVGCGACALVCPTDAITMQEWGGDLGGAMALPKSDSNDSSTITDY
ncbi:ATP-binding protein [Tuwongella immobilis]|uniref:4Fe-4S ferredoxin-type domain-containing protein n=1 Tax=Tuwongella immobilis TaxID=692036 RepID=A0A6C2YM24_9BACT|nr:4Fe-4S dicluster domain-containing protein [Tuwongella immobilis]VIP01972.1 Marine sediment metagenome DNA, contig: S12H4_S21815 OS=marine sediment metagenome GN=S12H4_56267 PE=4 SV=1: Fer4_7 [Tuwongella immobilis]VTS00003.1 Marine sediment metagenome DNA, contig: S12H4_S21815 OS=marine sediment metagenome GN=S12H4_56267 PE=4 SV=1: Fer4_7 [Tuwongella immobilis]